MLPSHVKPGHVNVIGTLRIKATMSTEFTEVPIVPPEPIETSSIAEGGFAFKQSIRNKATDEQLRKLGMGWIWAEGGTREHLRDCLTQKGWAVTPGKWKDGWKNAHKSEFIQAHFIFLDFDGDRPLVDAVADPFVQKNAAFIYTTASHGKKPGDRFRIVFELDADIFDLSTFNRVLTGLKVRVPGSDPMINGVSCLFGNDRARVIDFDPDNRLSVTDCLTQWEQVERKAVEYREQKKRPAASLFNGTNNDTENNLRRWLQPVPADSYDKWLNVGAWIKSVVVSGEIDDQQGLEIFTDWSITNYQGERERRNDPHFIERTWDNLTGGRNGTDGFVRANGLINIRRLYYATILEQLTETES